MKFKDPLATLKYLGGPPSMHLFMAIYAGIAFFQYGDFYCQSNAYPDTDKETDLTYIANISCMADKSMIDWNATKIIYDDNRDVLFSMIAHVTFISSYIIHKN